METDTPGGEEAGLAPDSSCGRQLDVLTPLLKLFLSEQPISGFDVSLRNRYGELGPRLVLLGSIFYSTEEFSPLCSGS